jgi:hypothetical protein
MENESRLPLRDVAGSVARAARQLDAAVWLALICVAAGWFFLDTLVVTAGPVRHGVPFYDLATVIRDPAQLFVGGRAPRLAGLVLGLVCLGALLSPLAPYLRNVRAAWLAYLTPLALLLACGALLYVRTSGDFLATPQDADSLTSGLLQLANGLIHKGSAAVSRRVSVGAGAYLALVGSLFLAARGIQRLRAPAPRAGRAARELAP